MEWLNELLLFLCYLAVAGFRFSPGGKCCGYKLTDCDNSETIKYTTAALGDYVDRVVQISGSEICWIVEELCSLPSGETYEDVTVTEDFDDCEACGCECYKLTNCEDAEDVFYSDSDLSDYVGLVVEVDEYDGCWHVACESETCGTVEAVTVLDSHSDCSPCVPSLPDCTACIDEKWPLQVLVTISGVANGTCSNCGTMYNGSFVLDAIFPNVSGSCRYRKELGNFPSGSGLCTGTAAAIEVRLVAELPPGTSVVSVTLQGAGTLTNPITPPINCLTLNETMTTHSSTFCDLSGVTCTVEAI